MEAWKNMKGYCEVHGIILQLFHGDKVQKLGMGYNTADISFVLHLVASLKELRCVHELH